MKFTIDPEEIRRMGVGKDVFFHVLCLYFHAFPTEKTCQEANRLGLNVKDIGSWSISRGGKDMVEKVLVLSKGHDKRPLYEYKRLARCLMDQFPKGVKPGTYTPWRGSVPFVAERLRLLETVADTKLHCGLAASATKDYVQSFGKDTTYMRTLPHFIFHAIGEEGLPPTWQSDLLSSMENIKNYEIYNQ